VLSVHGSCKYQYLTTPTALFKPLTSVPKFRLIPACAIRLYYLNPSTISSNRNFTLSLVAICTQLQLGLSIVTSSISSFKPLIAVYEKSSAADTANYYPRHSTYDVDDSGNRSRYSRMLDPITPVVGQENQHNISMPGTVLVGPSVHSSAASLRPNTHGRYSAKVSVDGKSSLNESKKSIRSRGVQQMIIERETCWSVHYDTDTTDKGDIDKIMKELTT
jgi:hypothetical protein